MTRTLTLLLGVAAMVAAIDLAQKQLALSERGASVLLHERSGFYVAGIGVAALLWARAIARIRSSTIAFAGGVVLGGAAGNLVSIALWPSLPGVPDPIVAGDVAFNVADVAVVAGFALLLPGTLVFAVQNRKRLFEPV